MHLRKFFHVSSSLILAISVRHFLLAGVSITYHLFGHVLGYILPKDSYLSMMSVMLRHVCRLTDQYCLFGLGGCLTRLEI